MLGGAQCRDEVSRLSHVIGFRGYRVCCPLCMALLDAPRGRCQGLTAETSLPLLPSGVALRNDAGSGIHALTC